MPRANYTDAQKAEAINLIKDMLSDQMTEMTCQTIADRTGVQYGSVLRWKKELEEGDPSKDTKAKTNGKSKIDYRTHYQLERLRGEYLCKGLDLTTDERNELEVEYLRTILCEVFEHEVPPLFPQKTSAPKKRGRPNKGA